MAGHEVIEPSNRKHIRQPPSVPFLWEERPGIAKKDWKPDWHLASLVTTIPALPSPIKLVASVPFSWEEMPGKPLSCFSESSTESSAITPQLKCISLPSPPMYSQKQNEQKFNNEDGMFNLDLKSFNFDADYLFSSSPSLTANCLVSSAAISAAVPALQTSSPDDIDEQLENCSSPASESDSSTSSYATGVSSLTGSSFLECLFPLYTPNASFLGEVGYSRKGYLSPPEPKRSNLGGDGNIVARKTPTLGELIMLSRSRSCQRKALQMAQWKLSMEFSNKKAFGCCIFGTGINMIEGLQRKRHIPRRKLP